MVVKVKTTSPPSLTVETSEAKENVATGAGVAAAGVRAVSTAAFPVVTDASVELTVEGIDHSAAASLVIVWYVATSTLWLKFAMSVPKTASDSDAALINS